jgi:subtilisin family serine protease
MHHRYVWFYTRVSALGILIALVGLMARVVAPLPARVSAASSSDYVSNEVLVKLKPLANLLDIVMIYGLDPNIGPNDQLGSLPIYRLRIIDGVSPLTKAAALALNPLVVYAEANYIGQAPEGVYQYGWSKGDNDDTGYKTQWAPDKIRLLEAHTASRGAGVTVAILDTGVDLTHPALAGRLVQGFDFVDLDADPSEEGAYGQDAAYGHGTHVAGLVALAAPDAKIMPLRILKPDGRGTSWLLAQAIRYATNSQVGVINLSYSVQHRSLLVDDVLSLVTSALPGAVVAAAAGNSGGSAPEYPAAEAMPGLLSVAASTPLDQLADFSTRAAWVKVAAPGEQIVSSVPLDSGSAYATWSGTSMATPLTAGLAALVRAAQPNLTPAEVAQQIIATSALIGGAVPHRIDAAAAVGLPAAQP